MSFFLPHHFSFRCDIVCESNIENLMATLCQDRLRDFVCSVCVECFLIHSDVDCRHARVADVLMASFHQGGFQALLWPFVHTAVTVAPRLTADSASLSANIDVNGRLPCERARVGTLLAPKFTLAAMVRVIIDRTFQRPPLFCSLCQGWLEGKCLTSRPTFEKHDQELVC